MPWTPAQRRLFAVQMRKGELTKKEFDRRMDEGTRKDVDKSGHSKTKAAKKSRRSSHRSRKRG